MKYDKMVAITQAESQRKMNIAKNTISDMLKNMERITVAELVKRTGLSRGFFYKNELIRREMDDAIHRQEAIFKNRHPVTMDRKLENSVIDLRIELLKAALAKNTGFAKSFFYRNPEVRKALDEALLQQGECYNPKKVIFDRALEETNNNLKTAVMRLKKQVAELEKEKSRLEKKVEELTRELEKQKK